MAKESSNNSSNKKSGPKKPTINEKDKTFIITLISVLVILAVAVILIYSLEGGEFSKNQNVTICPEGSKDVDACTKEYDPVCGYDSQGNQMDTFSNDCHACKKSEVAYFLNGECKQ